MTTQANEAGQPGQFGLFGDPVEVPSPRPVSRIESNNVDLMHTIAANAVRCGYLLVGQSERVYARITGDDDHVARVPRYEEDAVHQLLRRRWLTVGATHRVTCGAAHLIGTAVLVPKHTRDRITRWEHLQRPPSWPRDTARQHTGSSAGPPGSVCHFCGGTGRIPDSRQATWTPERGVHRANTSSLCHHCQPARKP
jgi:hypothetical protein